MRNTNKCNSLTMSIFHFTYALRVNLHSDCLNVKELLG